jgi:hypothetical protein
VPCVAGRRLDARAAVILRRHIPKKELEFAQCHAAWRCDVAGSIAAQCSDVPRALALPREFGKRVMFGTCTCNPAWTVVRDALPAGAHGRIHPDIVARAFMLKLKKFMHVVVHNWVVSTLRFITELSAR